jgi:D-arabinose 1-dehydrogenase-like Zn-dependent alcohol dehydrogenase
VEACGICHSDSVFVDDQWPGVQFAVTVGDADANPVVPGNGRLV